MFTLDLKNDTTIATLLLGTILLDTVNLNPKYKKVTQKDKLMVEHLCKVLKYNQNDQVCYYKCVF